MICRSTEPEPAKALSMLAKEVSLMMLWEYTAAMSQPL
jgi:hypothetical protein